MDSKRYNVRKNRKAVPSRHRTDRTPMSRKSKPQFEFDAALSFAGEDREHAEALAKKLEADGFSVF